MNKAKNLCMQGLTCQPERTLLRTIYLISQNRMTNACHMHTDLMRASRLKLAFHISVFAIEFIQNMIMCDGFFAVFSLIAIFLRSTG